MYSTVAIIILASLVIACWTGWARYRNERKKREDLLAQIQRTYTGSNEFEILWPDGSQS